MVYLRELRKPLSDYYEEFLFFFFEFANSYTEESVREGYLKKKKAETEDLSEAELKELGYTNKDLLEGFSQGNSLIGK